MLRAGAMAPLAIDPLGQPFAKHRLAAIGIVHAGWIGIVAKEAARIDDATELVVFRTIVARTHSPALFLRVPGYRQLRQFARSGKVQVTARMPSGSYDVSDLLLECANFVSTTVQLVPALIEFAVANEHAEMLARRSVKEMILFGVVFNDVQLRRRSEGPGHGNSGIRSGFIRMALPTDFSGCVTGRGSLCGREAQEREQDETDAARRHYTESASTGRWSLNANESGSSGLVRKAPS